MTADKPQSHIAPAIEIARAEPKVPPRRSFKISTNAASPYESAVFKSGIESVTAANIKNPKTTETATARKIPHGAVFLGFRVSSDTCAEAS